MYNILYEIVKISTGNSYIFPTIFFKIRRLRISGTRLTCVFSNTVKIANEILLIENLNHQFYWWVPALLSGQVGGDYN